MCEIFAASSKKAQRYDTYLSDFFSDSVKHPHGWGLCWHEGDAEKTTRLFKEPVTAIESSYLDYLLSMGIESKLLIAHIRNATRGIISYSNTHPFVGHDSSGRQWIFCHNGTIFEDELTKTFEAEQSGNTDSERIMLYVLKLLKEAQESCASSDLDDAARFELLAQAMEHLSPGNKLNLAFEDGEFLYVHSNTEQPTLFIHQSSDTILVCSRPLGDGWQAVEAGCLYAYREGELIRKSQAHNKLFDNDAYLRLIARWVEEDQGAPQA